MCCLVHACVTSTYGLLGQVTPDAGYYISEANSLLPDYASPLEVSCKRCACFLSDLAA